MIVYKSAEKLKCEKCRREVILVRPGEGDLICCGEAMKISIEGFHVDREFVQSWSKKYTEKYNSSENNGEGKIELDWIFKEKESARTTLQKVGLWEREIDDASDSAWLEYVTLLGKLSTDLIVSKRDLSKALFAYGRYGDNYERCPYCNGVGKVDGPASAYEIVTCPVCKGGCYNYIPDGSQPCRACYGIGEFIHGSSPDYYKKPCPDCAGTGWIPG